MRERPIHCEERIAELSRPLSSAAQPFERPLDYSVDCRNLADCTHSRKSPESSRWRFQRLPYSTFIELVLSAKMRRSCDTESCRSADLRNLGSSQAIGQASHGVFWGSALRGRWGETQVRRGGTCRSDTGAWRDQLIVQPW